MIAVRPLAAAAHGRPRLSIRTPIAWTRASPWLGVTLLAAIALAAHYSYLTPTPLNSDDWGWYSHDAARSLAPWPSLWDPTAGFGANTLAVRNFLPIHSIIGWLAATGLAWGVIEKVTYFVPFVVLSVVGPFVLARHLLRSTPCAAAAALLYASNSYVLLVAQQGQLTIGVAEGVAPLVLWSHLRAARPGATRWGVVTGILLGVQTAYDLRIAYVTVLCILLELSLAAVTVRSRDAVRLLAGRAFVPFAVYGVTQLYWIVPALAYHGDRNLPLASDLFVPYTTLGHGVAGLHPFWTGDVPSYFHTLAPSPAALLLPVAAFSVLARRRVSRELVWLSMCGLVAAFLLKQDRPPFDGVYPWMFQHVPGWNLLRESSKLFWVVALALAILVPEAARGAVDSIRSALGPRGRSRAEGLRSFSRAWSKVRAHWRVIPPVLAVAAVALIAWLDSVSNLVPLAEGRLGGTTQAAAEPASFAELSAELSSDPQSSAVAWLGGAYAVDGADVHHTPITSTRHPLVELDGQPPTDAVTGRAKDVLTRFCPSAVVPFCYLDRALFPYLVRETGIGYVVAPAGTGVGILPAGTWQSDLVARATEALGATPRTVGSGPDALAVWRVVGSTSLAGSAPFVVRIVGGPPDTTSVLPLLDALRMPTVYATDAEAEPLAATVTLLPNSGRGFRVTRSSSYAVFTSSAGTPSVFVDGVLRQVTRIASVRGGGLLGPLALQPGLHAVDVGGTLPSDARQQARALVEWTPTSAATLASPPEQMPAQDEVLRDSISITGIRDRYLISRSTFDPQWTVAGAGDHLQADSLFNLFVLPEHTSDATMVFTAHESGHLGLLLSAIGTPLMIGLILAAAAPPWRLRRAARSVSSAPAVCSYSAAGLARAGIVFLLFAAAEAFVNERGLPSVLPQLFSTAPGAPLGYSYALAVDFYAAVAIGALLLSLVVRVALDAAHARRTDGPITVTDAP